MTFKIAFGCQCIQKCQSMVSSGGPRHVYGLNVWLMIYSVGLSDALWGTRDLHSYSNNVMPSRYLLKTVEL